MMEWLQYIGTAVAGILCFLFLLTAIPIRYRAEVVGTEAAVRVSWLFGLVSKKFSGSDMGKRKETKPAEPVSETKPLEAEEKRTKPAWKVFFYALENGTVALVFDAMRKILRHSRFSESVLEGRAGTGDPMKTGILAGLALCYFPECRVEWDYVNRCTELVFRAKGRIVLLYILYVLTLLAMEKPVRQTVSYRRRASWTTPQESRFSKNSSK